MTPYQITINWEFDYDILKVLEKRFQEILERARFFKESGHSCKFDLELLREYKQILKQIREHKDLRNW